MIRFLGNRKPIRPLQNSQFLLKFSFCQKKPEDNNIPKSNKQRLTEGKPKIKFVTGSKNFHPMYRMAEKNLIKNMRERFDQQRKLIQKINMEKQFDERSYDLNLFKQKLEELSKSFGGDQIDFSKKAVKKETEKQSDPKKQEESQQIEKKQSKEENKVQEEKQKSGDGKRKAKKSWFPYPRIRKIGLICTVFYCLYQILNTHNLPKQNQIDKIQASQLNEYTYKWIQMDNQKTAIQVIRKKFQNKVTILISKHPENQLIDFKNIKKIIMPEEMLPSFLVRIQNLYNKKIAVKFYYDGQSDSNLLQNLNKLSLLVIAYYVIQWRLKGGKGFSFKPSKSKNPTNTGTFAPITPDKMNILFKDVAGMHQAKIQVTQFIQFLKDNEKYKEMGAKVPKGVLLTGPPGTGKTLLAKACAGEAKVNFFSLSGSEFVQKFSGLGASRVRQLFDKAEQCAPSIIFIDEIDAIGKKRDAGPFSNEERDNTLNQLLVRMDGFETKHQVIVMAATNRKDMLDPALLRPGRFDRSVEIGLPNYEERRQILAVHLKKINYDPAWQESELTKKISVLTPGFSGAELANTCNQAAILAARQDLDKVLLRHFEKATERVMAGLEKRNVFTPQQKQMLAYYECGKAIVSWFTQGSDPVIKISILPFSKSRTGFSHSINSQTALYTLDQLLAKVSCYLAGRASQIYFKGYSTTNGDNDLQRAKKIITMIVTKFGMSDRLKMMAFPDFQFIRKPYSERIEGIIDQQIQKLSQQCQSRVQALIKQKEKEILLLKDKLLQKQTLTHNCIKQVLGERKVKSQNLNYQEYLREQQEAENKEGEVIQPQPGTQ